MAAVPVLNLTGDDAIIQGSTYGPLPIQILDEDGDPIDLSGYAARAQIRADYADVATTIIAEFDAQVINAPAGVIAISLTATQTEALQAILSGKWDMEIYDAVYVRRVVQGVWEVSREVTRAAA